MCTVSMVGDVYSDRWRWVPDRFQIDVPITRAEFELLKRDVEEMKELLKAAKRIDVLTGNPECEMEEKIATLRKVAELVGIDLDDVFAR